MSFADMIFHHAMTRPNKPAIILADRVVTYGMMAAGIRSVSDRIRALRLAPGALVVVAIESPIRHLIVAAALFRCGHVLLSIRRTRDIPSGLAVSAILEGEREALVPGLKQILVEDDWFTGAPQPFAGTPESDRDGDGPCVIALSSGTTGQPKISSFSANAFNQTILTFHTLLGLANWDRMLSLLGLSSYFGFSLAAHVLYAGKTLSFVATARDALNLIALYRIDCLVGSPQHVGEMLDEQRESPVPCPSLALVYLGGGFVSHALMSDTRANLCGNIVVGYGSTETGGNAFAPVERLIGTEGAAGFVVPWSKIEVVDAEDHVLPPGRDGIVRIRTEGQARPYPESSADQNPSFRDGWFYPGDLGRVTEDGMLVLAGRASEIIRAGGVSLAPERIEEVLRNHPDIADAAAFAGSSADGTEEIWVAIVPRAGMTATPEAVKRLYAEKGIPVAGVVTVASIPRNQMGKVERERLKRSRH